MKHGAFTERSGTRLRKPASVEEARWTAFLAPTVYLGYRRGHLLLRRLPGPTLADENGDPAPWWRAVDELARLHRRALSPVAPPLPPPRDWQESLAAAWRSPRGGTMPAERALLEAIDELLPALRGCSRQGVFLDANPHNWVLQSGVPVAIDFGHVARASFASDLSQLLDHVANPLSTEAAAAAWARAYGGAAARTALADLPGVAIFSALCRAPHHPPAQRRPWYRGAADRARHLGLERLARHLAQAAEPSR